MVAATLLGLPTRAAEGLKDIFKDHFIVGTAVNRGMVTGAGFRRSAEQLAQDIALVKQHFKSPLRTT